MCQPHRALLLNLIRYNKFILNNRLVTNRDYVIRMVMTIPVSTLFMQYYLCRLQFQGLSLWPGQSKIWMDTCFQCIRQSVGQVLCKYILTMSCTMKTDVSCTGVCWYLCSNTVDKLIEMLGTSECHFCNVHSNIPLASYQSVSISCVQYYYGMQMRILQATLFSSEAQDQVPSL